LLGLGLAVGAGCKSSDEAEDPPPVPASEYKQLSQTGLFRDIGAKGLHPDVLAFEPRFKLWSDGANKLRWIRLPKGTTIDTTDPDHWQMPVGTRFFKEFSVAGKRIETRLVERIAATGKAEDDYWMGSFLWREDESDADFVPDGALNARGTTHDVPDAKACWTCHQGEPGKALGFSSVQLTNAPGEGLTLARLRERALLSGNVDDVALTGDERAVTAIGYLHANCGHCHNPNGIAWVDTDAVMRLTASDRDVAASGVHRTNVGVDLFNLKGVSVALRIAPAKPDESGIVLRMSHRGDELAMPPVASELVDEAGVDAVRAWIASLQ